MFKAMERFQRVRLHKPIYAYHPQSTYNYRMKTRGNIFNALSKLNYSLRSLLILLTFLCIYFGAWEITKRWVVDDLLKDPASHCESSIPFVAVIDEIDYRNYRYLRRYHFVCLGLKAKLPFAGECHARKPIVLGGVIPRIIIQEEEETLALNLR